MSKEIFISGKNITKEYIVGGNITRAVNNVSLDIFQGDFIAITGKSGSGKSTLLYQLSLLDKPSSGTISIHNEPTADWSEGKRTKTRLSTFGYVFQEYALVPELTAIENVLLPMFMEGSSYNEAKDRAEITLEKVGLSHRLHHLPNQLSGGEQQRVSIARSIINKPDILFADEPTANLDSETSKVVMEIFKTLNKDGLTIVMVTHEDEYALLANSITTLKDGRIISKS